ncbi:MAG: hypothetical protein JNL25_15705 [Rhodospirillaceae bacterium]|nr:hypothetical protein [Rhodospirillaceae bacterium]
MIDKKVIRELIRDVIAEEVKHLKSGKAAPATHAVRIASDADLAAFARDVLHLAEDPKQRAAILAGSHSFRLAGSAAATPAAGTGHVSKTDSHRIDSHRIDKGVVTEAVIARLPKGVARLLLGPGVSITPLARDKARSRNISVERIGP